MGQVQGEGYIWLFLHEGCLLILAYLPALHLLGLGSGLDCSQHQG